MALPDCAADQAAGATLGVGQRDVEGARFQPVGLAQVTTQFGAQALHRQAAFVPAPWLGVVELQRGQNRHVLGASGKHGVASQASLRRLDRQRRQIKLGGLQVQLRQRPSLQRLQARLQVHGRRLAAAQRHTSQGAADLHLRHVATALEHGGPARRVAFTGWPQRGLQRQRQRRQGADVQAGVGVHTLPFGLQRVDPVFGARARFHHQALHGQALDRRQRVDAQFFHLALLESDRQRRADASRQRDGPRPRLARAHRDLAGTELLDVQACQRVVVRPPGPAHAGCGQVFDRHRLLSLVPCQLDPFGLPAFAQQGALKALHLHQRQPLQQPLRARFVEQQPACDAGKATRHQQQEGHHHRQRQQQRQAGAQRRRLGVAWVDGLVCHDAFMAHSSRIQGVQNAMPTLKCSRALRVSLP